MLLCLAAGRNLLNRWPTLRECGLGPIRRPKVLLVENSLHMTGAFVSALEIADALKDTHDVEFVLPSASTLHDVVARHGVTCHPLPMSEIGRSWKKLVRYVPVLILNTFRLRWLLERRNVDILLINDYYNLLGVSIRLSGWRCGTLLTMVQLMPLNQQRVLNRVWTALGLIASKYMVAVSRAVASQLPCSRKTVTLYNPVSLCEKYPQQSAREVGQADEVHCLYLANYIAGKGHHIALDAFACAASHNPALRLRFVGGDMGLQKNRALKADLIRQVSELGLEAKVLVDGYSEDVERDIKNSDIVLNFSESESFSHTCLEACAFGRPIIATRCGGPEEIVDDGVSGILVPVRDMDAMVAALSSLGNDPAKRLSMGQAGRRIVRQRFSTEAFVHGFKRLTAS